MIPQQNRKRLVRACAKRIKPRKHLRDRLCRSVPKGSYNWKMRFECRFNVSIPAAQFLHATLNIDLALDRSLADRSGGLCPVGLGLFRKCRRRCVDVGLLLAVLSSSVGSAGFVRITSGGMFSSGRFSFTSGSTRPFPFLALVAFTAIFTAFIGQRIFASGILP